MAHTLPVCLKFFQENPIKLNEFTRFAADRMYKKRGLSETARRNFTLMCSILTSMVAIPEYLDIIDMNKDFLLDLVPHWFNFESLCMAHLTIPCLINLTRSPHMACKLLKTYSHSMKKILMYTTKKHKDEDTFDLWLSVLLNFSVTEKGRW